MKGTYLTPGLYIPAIAISEEAKAAEAIAQQIAYHLDQAKEMGQKAKEALNKILRNKAAYERQLKQRETKKRRDAINKHSNLRASFKAAEDAFHYHGKQSLALAKRLAELMPHLIADGKNYDSTVPSMGRQANAVLASRLILQIPVVLEKIALEFKPKDILDVAHGINEIMELRSRVVDNALNHRFDRHLSVPYVTGANGDAAFAKLETSMQELKEALEASEQVSKAYLDAKSRYFSCEWDQPDRWTSDPQTTAESFATVQVDFEIARWSLENAKESIWSARCTATHALKAASEKLYASRFSDFSVLSNNTVAVKLLIVKAEDCTRTISRLLDKESDAVGPIRSLHTRAYEAMQESFASIPADYCIPDMQFLK